MKVLQSRLLSSVKQPLLFAAAICALAGVAGGAQTQPDAAKEVYAPHLQVDPLWPKPLPNHWILGQAVGVTVDQQNHIWIVHRGSDTLAMQEKWLDIKAARCCTAAPPVLEFDQAGNLLRAWGGPGAGYDWPEAVHGVAVDHRGNVWIASSGPSDSQILKFTADGKFLLQFGKKGVHLKPGAEASSAPPGGYLDAMAAKAAIYGRYAGHSHDTTSFGRPAKIFVDPETNEAYIADGYLNRRIAVIDADTGKFKRFWGAYGKPPSDPALPPGALLTPYSPSAPPSPNFSTVHCVIISTDRLVYVCDRENDRIQVFDMSGKFVREARIDPDTLIAGSIWDIAFSADPEQKFLYVADGTNNEIKVVERKTLKVLTRFGDGGRQPGAFYGVHSIASDQQGNVYTTETWEGKRVQRFVYKGMANLPAVQGPPWPAR